VAEFFNCFLSEGKTSLSFLGLSVFLYWDLSRVQNQIQKDLERFAISICLQMNQLSIVKPVVAQLL